MRYVYSVVRFVPNPASGEFVNVGAIAGSEEAGDWSVRQAQSPKRARNFGPAESLNALFAFLNDVGRQIDLADSLDGGDVELSEAWLVEMYECHQNIVQLSPPTPLLADTAEEALDLVFAEVIEPDSSPEARNYLTKHRLLSTLRTRYRQAGIEAGHVRERATLTSGGLHAPIDFVVANGRAVQLAQTWSFQIVSHTDVAKEVKAWGYTMRALRECGGTVDGAQAVEVDRDVRIEVLYAAPRTDAQRSVFEEAEQVFADVDAVPHALEDAGAISTAAAATLLSHGKSFDG